MSDRNRLICCGFDVFTTLMLQGSRQVCSVKRPVRRSVAKTSRKMCTEMFVVEKHLWITEKQTEGGRGLVEIEMSKKRCCHDRSASRFWKFRSLFGGPRAVGAKDPRMQVKHVETQHVRDVFARALQKAPSAVAARTKRVLKVRIAKSCGSGTGTSRKQQ